jgi:hypothetical protein
MPVLAFIEPIDPTLTIAISSAASIVLTVLGGLWKITNWLRDKFNEVEYHLETLLDTHEDKDHRRHEDNIQRFSVIETQLNTLIKNGKH